MGRDLEIFTRLMKEVIEEDHGEFIRIQLPGYLAKKLRAYFGIKSDLQLVKSTFLDYCNPDIKGDRTAFYYMIIVLYGKCFTDATKMKNPKLDEDILAGKQELLELHRELMDTRHNFIAHRGDTDQEDAVVYIAFEAKNPLNFYARAKRGKREHFKGAYPEKYVELFDFLIGVADDRIEKHTKKSFKHLMDKYTDEQLTRLFIVPKNLNENLKK